MAKLSSTRLRRILTVPGVLVLAVGLTITAPIWLPVAFVVDLVRGRTRFPTLRLLSLGLWWAWLETSGVAMATGLWLVGQSRNHDAHYRLQGWWAGRLVAGLRFLFRLRMEIDGIEALDGGPLVICARHSSLADSLLPAYLLAQTGSMRPHYVMKRELLVDPCLDVVGNRLPNFFVDRDATDSAPELAGIEQMARALGPRDAAVIYPEGGVGTPARRFRAMAKLVDRDPDRFRRLALLTHLVPPRAKGTVALLRGAPDADVVLMAHVGLEGLGRGTHATRGIPLRGPVRVRLQRIPRSEVPREIDLPAWLDQRWLEMDAWIEAMSSGDAPPVPPVGAAPTTDARAAVS